MDVVVLNAWVTETNETPRPSKVSTIFAKSVSERVKTHGRAFGDPEKGAPGQALSALQGRKLKEITAKAKGEAPKGRWGRKERD